MLDKFPLKINLMLEAVPCAAKSQIKSGMGFVVNNLAAVFLQMLSFSLVSVTLLIFHVHALIYHWCSVTLAYDRLLIHLKCDIYINHRGDFLGLEEMNDNGMKTVHVGTMGRGFTVS